MSEQEFNKWKNKFKLWKTLHYDVDLEEESYCNKCIHSFFTAGKCFRRCPDSVLMYAENDAGEMEILNLDKTDVLTALGICVEWIKHV